MIDSSVTYKVDASRLYMVRCRIAMRKPDSSLSLRFWCPAPTGEFGL
jgi:hypothetical protein